MPIEYRFNRNWKLEREGYLHREIARLEAEKATRFLTKDEKRTLKGAKQELRMVKHSKDYDNKRLNHANLFYDGDETYKKELKDNLKRIEKTQKKLKKATGSLKQSLEARLLYLQEQESKQIYERHQARVYNKIVTEREGKVESNTGKTTPKTDEPIEHIEDKDTLDKKPEIKDGDQTLPLITKALLQALLKNPEMAMTLIESLKDYVKGKNHEEVIEETLPPITASNLSIREGIQSESMSLQTVPISGNTKKVNADEPKVEFGKPQVVNEDVFDNNFEMDELSSNYQLFLGGKLDSETTSLIVGKNYDGTVEVRFMLNGESSYTQRYTFNDEAKFTETILPQLVDMYSSNNEPLNSTHDKANNIYINNSENGNNFIMTNFQDNIVENVENKIESKKSEVISKAA